VQGALDKEASNFEAYLWRVLMVGGEIEDGKVALAASNTSSQVEVPAEKLKRSEGKASAVDAIEGVSIADAEMEDHTTFEQSGDADLDGGVLSSESITL
jgi:hypothetical protein